MSISSPLSIIALTSFEAALRFREGWVVEWLASSGVNVKGGSVGSSAELGFGSRHELLSDSSNVSERETGVRNGDARRGMVVVEYVAGVELDVEARF